MRLGYNTNGLAHHRVLDAIALLADEGYESIALTIDPGVLDPFDDPGSFRRQIHDVSRALDHAGLSRVIETGGRYLLNPRRKHDPTLMDADPDRRGVRIEFLRRAIEIADELQADAVSLWSGALTDPITDDQAIDRLVEGLKVVLEYAETRDVVLGFEPEPGMFIDTMARFVKLDERIRHPLFQLTLDLGHLHCVEIDAEADIVTRFCSRIVNVHIEDMRRGVHDHLMFGDGTMDFAPILRALREIGYAGGLNVELSRHSHIGVDAVQRSAAYLLPYLA